MKQLLRLVCGIVLIASLAACAVPPVSITPTLAIVPSASPTITPTVRPTTSTATPTALPPATLPPTATPTTSPTLAPTLTDDQRTRLVLDLLKNNGGCELPCWWGITPGQTDYQTLKNIFTAYGGSVFDIPRTLPFQEYRIYHDFTQQNEIVESIHVTAEVRRSTHSARFVQEWQHFSLDQMLTRYGLPSQVMLEMTNLCLEPGCLPAPYNLFVFYDQLGILVRYQGPAIRGDPIRACPTFNQVEYLELWFQSPEEKSSLLHTANLDPSELGRLQSFADTTGMSIEKFYQAFKNPKNKTCFESPSKDWQ